MVKNLSSNAGDASSIPGWGTKSLHATEQLTPPATNTEPAHSGAFVLQWKDILHAATKTQCRKMNYIKKKKGPPCEPCVLFYSPTFTNSSWVSAFGAHLSKGRTRPPLSPIRPEPCFSKYVWWSSSWSHEQTEDGTFRKPPASLSPSLSDLVQTAINKQLQTALSGWAIFWDHMNLLLSTSFSQIGCYEALY